LASELGLSNEQAQKIAQYDVQRAQQSAEANHEAYQQQVAEATEELRKEWKGDSFDYNIAKVKDVINHLNGSEWVDTPEIANNPAFIKWAFDNIVPLVDNDKIIENRQTQSVATLTDELVDLESKMFSYEGQTNSEEYKRMVARRGELLSKLPQKA